jgi:hypothetical protein
MLHSEGGAREHAVTLAMGGGAALAAVGTPVGLVPALGFMGVLLIAPGTVADVGTVVAGMVVTAIVAGWAAVAGGLGLELGALLSARMHRPARVAYLVAIGLEVVPWLLVGGWFAAVFAVA